MSYNFNQFNKGGEDAYEWLKKEYTNIRTSRAVPSILDSITVESYGSKMPINQLATITVEDPKTLRITPWDKEVIKSIDKAIRESNLGLSVSLDGVGLRVSFPELTSERRTMLSRLLKEKLEEARIAVRSEREKALSTIDREEKDGNISEDDKFRFKAELQKLVDELNNKLEELAQKKDKEILE